MKNTALCQHFNLNNSSPHKIYKGSSALKQHLRRTNIQDNKAKQDEDRENITEQEYNSCKNKGLM